MPKLEITNLPQHVYQHIEDLAKIHGRTVAEEATELLFRTLDDCDLMAEIRDDRRLMEARGVFASEDEINRAKNWGRE